MYSMSTLNDPCFIDAEERNTIWRKWYNESTNMINVLTEASKRHTQPNDTKWTISITEQEVQMALDDFPGSL